ncbi:MAG: hypothetical protein JWQ38_3049 [Flavipsychrobacter sp.]|nr:hypothetical protein [Flavipsychrobacter sp.]
MEYREIVAVTGLGGLYQLLTTKSDGAIVRNVADKTTRFISARQHNVTPLESIEVYTTGDNVRLHNVFQKMKDQETKIPLADAKSADNTAIKSYFKSIFPEFDEERVYVSDMKKMLKWYEILKANDLLRFEQQDADDAAANAPEEAPAAEAAPEEKPAKKAAKKAEAPVAEEGEAKPKKAAAKKATKKAEADDAAAGEEKPAKKAAPKKKKTEE